MLCCLGVMRLKATRTLGLARAPCGVWFWTVSTVTWPRDRRTRARRTMVGLCEAATSLTPSMSNASTWGRHARTCRFQARAPMRSTGCTHAQTRHLATGPARPSAHMAKQYFGQIRLRMRTHGLVQARATSGVCFSRADTYTWHAAVPTYRRPADGSCGVVDVADRSRRRPWPVHVRWHN